MTCEYEVHGKKIVLEEDEDLVAVRYKEPAPHSMRASVAERGGLGPFSKRIELPKERFTIFQVAQTAQPRQQRYGAAMAAVREEKEVARVAPVFKLGNNRVVATDRVVVGFKEKVGNVEKLLKEHDCRVLEADGQEYLAELPETADPLEVAAKLASCEEVDFAEPDFVTIGRHIARRAPAGTQTAGDPLAEKQYAIFITEAVEAWERQMGDPRVRVAILDEGVDTQHEDLAGAVVGAYDGVDDDEFQEPHSWDAHGTACGGLAAAIHSNERGIKGIGGGCSMLAVRIAYSPFPGGDWVARDWWIKRAIDWSWKNGADVLSNSWGGGAPSSLIANAIERARTQGRGGKGCVVVAAAGNDAGPVIYPGALDGVLTVSASNEQDEPKTPTSADGETWWGTNYGPEVDVAAPGVHNYTTDISGQGGYSDGNYVEGFNGTSSATPIVAGAAALVLSADGGLTEVEVREIICDTADKVGPLPYVDGRNDFMGFGRVNVREAVERALGQSGEANTLKGVIRQVGQAQPRAATIYLETDSGGTYGLKAYTGVEALAWQVLEERSLAYLSQFIGQEATVAFARRQDSARGTMLWGVTVT
jgi:subtilisin family serine protease